jgi:hypothetical protein
VYNFLFLMLVDLQLPLPLLQEFLAVLKEQELQLGFQLREMGGGRCWNPCV